MVSLLQEVVLHGTGAAAARLKYPLAGKTGTTNEYTDAWFVGFSPSITCGVWMGFDEKRTLGAKETGSEAALPIWIDFMRVAILNPAVKNESFAPASDDKPVTMIKKAQIIPPRHADGLEAR
jgi:penicillin-binding protein 1A